MIKLGIIKVIQYGKSLAIILTKYGVKAGEKYEISRGTRDGKEVIVLTKI